MSRNEKSVTQGATRTECWRKSGGNKRTRRKFCHQPPYKTHVRTVAVRGETIRAQCIHLFGEGTPESNASLLGLNTGSFLRAVSVFRN